MNVDYNKHNIVKYLANNKDKDIWKMSVSSIGFQSTKFLDSYPPKGHPFGYTFNPERGRILDEFSLEAVLISFDKFVKHDLDECNLYHSFCGFSKEFIIDGQPSEVFQP